MNLLTDPLFRIQAAHGVESVSLPALMATLGRDGVEHLVGIQRHQEDAFHVFLCQLATAILARAGHMDPVQSEDYWREGLLSLAGDAGDDAWKLVVDDLSRPAFMQSPLPEEDAKNLKLRAHTPDELDLLATAKNHEVKKARALHPHADEWIYALMSVQTMSGFFGRGNPGISRMNSGFGNRSIVELVRRHTPGSRWCDAVPRLLQHRQEVLAGPYGYDPHGQVLVWIESWDGRSQLPLSRLDPLCVEICRRVRLRGQASVSHADAVPSDSPRIHAKELNGVVGDAWLPIDLGKPGDGKLHTEKALTISPQGLTPDTLRRLVFVDGVKLSPLQRPLPSWDGEAWLTISVLVRGQGTTDGFHEQSIRIPAATQRRLFGPPEQREPLAALSRAGIDYAGTMRNRVLRPAVFAYLEGAPDRIMYDRDSAQAWWDRLARRFDNLWSDDYFPWLWSVPEPFDEQDVLNRVWALKLRDHALRVLREVERAMPSHAGRRYRSSVLAERVFWGCLYRKDNFPFFKEGGKE